MIIKCDQEFAVTSIMDKVRQLRGEAGITEAMVPEHSPVKSFQSNGLVERAVRSVEGQMRTLRDALEYRIGVVLNPKDSIWPWLIEYASYVLNRNEVGHDGKTAYERLKGKAATVLGIEFGESVHWKRNPTKGEGLSKLQVTWADGVFLGIKGTTGEVFVGTPEGCFKTRTVQRKPLDERWRAEEIRAVAGVPWRSSEEDPHADGEKLESRKLTEEELGEIRDKVRIQDRNVQPKQFQIRLKDILEHGLTPECRGCSTHVAGRAREAHTSACRKRFETIFADHPRIQAAKERERKYVNGLVEEEMRRVQAKEAKANRAREEVGRKRDLEQTVPEEELTPDTGGASGSGGNGGRKRNREADEEEEMEGPEKRVHVNLMEGNQRNWASHEMPVNDDLEKLDWSNRAIMAIEYPEECEYFDNLTGERLEPDLVRSSRCEEMGFVKSMPVYEEAPEAECWEKTGRKPIGTRWVDVRKGGGVRSRWVAQDFKPKGDGNREDLFAAMPPLEAKKILFQMAARRMASNTTERPQMKLMFIDVRKAHLNAKCDREDVYVALPPGAGAKTGTCGRLIRWLYGMRGAAQGWEHEFTNKLQEIGFRPGKSNLVVFFRQEG